MQYYITRNNQQLGPFTEAQVRAQLAAGTISPQDHVWWQGQQGWIPLAQSALVTSTAPGLATPLHPAAPAPAFNPSAPDKTSGMAIASLVCGCLTLLCGLLAAIPAIILGHLALGEIKKKPGVSGRGLALTGLIIGYVMTVLSIVGIAIYLTLLPTILKQIKVQQQSGQLFTPTPSTNSPDDSSTNSTDQTTNTDQPTATPTNSATATPASTDMSTNSSDSSATNSAPSTNAPDSSTNAAPMSQ